MKHLPFDHQNHQRQPGQPFPEFVQADLLGCGGGDGGASDLQFLARTSNQLGGVEQVDGEVFNLGGVFGDEVDGVVAEFVGFAEEGLSSGEGVGFVRGRGDDDLLRVSRRDEGQGLACAQGLG